MWMQRIKESTPNKKLSLIYLANGPYPPNIFSTITATNTTPEIVQQSKIRKKDEFVKAYDPIIVEATSAAYKGSSSDVQNKIRRVVEVWRQRQVFHPQIQTQIEAAIDDLDRTRSSRKPALGGSLFSSSSIPSELSSVAPLATSLQKADIAAKPALSTANQEYEKLTNPNNPIPTPPVHAAALSALVNKLATAESAVSETLKARQALITGLEKLLETNKTKLTAEQTQLHDLSSRKTIIEGRKREVEEAIIKGLSAPEQHAISAAPLPVSATGGAKSYTPPARPDIEELTPPPMESFTPVGSPQLQPAAIPDDVFPEAAAHPIEQAAIPAPPGHTANSTAPATAIGAPNPLPGTDLLAHLTHARPSDENGANGAQTHHAHTLKKRKMSRSAVGDDEYAAFAGDGELDGIENSVGDLI
jgi:regulator of Ty1 transposition protein 103